MNDRLVTAGGVLLALVIVYALFFGRGGEPPVTRPVTAETGRNGYAAVASWLRREGVPVISLRERYLRLTDGDAPHPPRGNLLITTLPHARPVRSNEVEALRAWVEDGNTLLVMAALDDTPEWAVAPVTDTGGLLRHLEAISGLRFEPLPADDEAADGGPAVPMDTPVVLEAAGAHPLLAGVGRLRGYSDQPSALWSAEPVDGDGLLLRLAVEATSGADAMWQAPRGAGQIILVASGSLLTNHVVAESGAARLLANVIGHHLAPGGAVLFDDMHQGVSVLYDPAAFYGDPRVHRTVLLLIALWLVYVLGSSNRLAPPAAPGSDPRQADFLRAAGGFLARRLDRRDAGLLLIEEWFDEIRRARALAGSEPPWEALEATPSLGRRTCEELRRMHGRLASGGRVDLVQLHNLLRRARRAIG